MRRLVLLYVHPGRQRPLKDRLTAGAKRVDDSASSAGLVVLRADSCSPAVLFLLSPGLGVAAHGHRVGTSRRTTGDMRVDDFASGAASGALQECAHLDQPTTLCWTSACALPYVA